MSDQRQARVFVTGGDSAANFSGSALFFMDSLKKELPDFVVQPVPMQTYRALYVPTALWGLQMRTDPRPYFFMTRQYQDANWSNSLFNKAPGDILISFPQIIPSDRVHSFSKLFIYADMTHRQYLGYPQFKGIPSRIREQILFQELESYRRADRIFVFTSDVEQQLRDHYRVPQEKIEIVGRGLNMPAEQAMPESLAAQPKAPDTIRIGFIGFDYQRKGLMDLIAAIDADEVLQQRVMVDVIGPSQNDLPSRDFLHGHGYIDKDQNMGKFLTIVKNCDLGYLFSQSEGIPGSVLEFLACNVPCIISDIRPMESIASLPGVLCLPLAGGSDVVGKTLRGLLAAPSRLAGLKTAACNSTFNGWQDQARVVAHWCRA